MVLVEGTDYTGASAAFEFELNVTMAMNLAAPVLLVLSAHEHRPEQVRGAFNAARQSLHEHEVNRWGVAVNRVDHDTCSVPAIAERLQSSQLRCGSSQRNAACSCRRCTRSRAELQAHMLLGTQESLDREVTGVRVAAMTLPNLLDRLQDGVLLVTPGDRSRRAAGGRDRPLQRPVPSVSGVIVTGGVAPDRASCRSPAAWNRPSPRCCCPTPTPSTPPTASPLTPQIRFGDDRRIAAALGAFESPRRHHGPDRPGWH